MWCSRRMIRHAGPVLLSLVLLQAGGGGMAACAPMVDPGGHAAHESHDTPDLPSHHDPLTCCAAASCCMGDVLSPVGLEDVGRPAWSVAGDPLPRPAPPHIAATRRQPPANAPPLAR